MVRIRVKDLVECDGPIPYRAFDEVGGDESGLAVEGDEWTENAFVSINRIAEDFQFLLGRRYRVHQGENVESGEFVQDDLLDLLRRDGDDLIVVDAGYRVDLPLHEVHLLERFGIEDVAVFDLDLDEDGERTAELFRELPVHVHVGVSGGNEVGKIRVDGNTCREDAEDERDDAQAGEHRDPVPDDPFAQASRHGYGILFQVAPPSGEDQTAPCAPTMKKF